MNILDAARAAGMNGGTPVVIGTDVGRPVSVTNAGYLYLHPEILKRWGVEHGSPARVAMVYQHGILYVAPTDEERGLKIHWNDSGGGWVYVKTLLAKAFLLPFTVGKRVRCKWDVFRTEEFPPVLRIDMRGAHRAVFPRNPYRHGEGEWENPQMPKGMVRGAG